MATQKLKGVESAKTPPLRYAEGQGCETLSRALPKGCVPLESHYLKGFLRAEKGGGSSLYRLPAFCHADSLIHAVRFFRKEKSSLLPG